MSHKIFDLSRNPVCFQIARMRKFYTETTLNESVISPVIINY